ncbi:unannotated protein [freshwater metagenome]|uniref:Unannotated protein n=1 Tax=freshwater metagenome TaxID=449393 RepID=A0A6J6K725_9ZZZZ
MKRGCYILVVSALALILNSCGISNDRAPRPIDPSRQDQLNSQP